MPFATALKMERADYALVSGVKRSPEGVWDEFSLAEWKAAATGLNDSAADRTAGLKVPFHARERQAGARLHDFRGAQASEIPTPTAPQKQEIYGREKPTGIP
jgi:hypothetical protein